MSKSGSDSYDLRVALQVSEAEERLLRAIRCPNSGIGVIDALGFAIGAIDVLLKVEELPRVKKWRQVARNLLLKCEELEEGQNGDEAHTELRSLSPSESISVFSALANPPTNTLDEGQSQNSLEILGRLIAAACSNGTHLNSLAIEGWATLRRSGQHRRGRSADWHRAAASIPRNPAELNDAFKYAQSVQLRALLEEIQLAIATSITEPIDAPRNPLATQTQDNQGASSTSITVSNETTVTDVDELEDPDNEGTSTAEPDEQPNTNDAKTKALKKAKDAPTRWLLQQANFSRFTQHFGLIGDRERLHPEAVKRIWHALMASFRDGNEQVKDFVALAHLSFKSSLPAKMTLERGFNNTRYPYFDLDGDAFVWNYGHTLHKDIGDDEILPQPRSNVEIIRVGLDAEIAAHLRNRHVQGPDANNVKQLFQIGSDPAIFKAWIRSYRKFLRSLGDAVHPAYDARFARSGGDVCRFVTGSDIASIFLAQAFQSCSTGMLHYLTLSTQFLDDCNKKFDAYLGFQSTAQQEDSPHKGADLHISPLAYQEGWNRLQGSTAVEIASMRHAENATQLVASFNALATRRLVAFISVTGHRGQKFARLTWRALYTHKDLIYVYDKDVGNYQSDRVVPAHPFVDQILAAWQQDISIFQARAKALGLELLQGTRRGIAEVSLDQPVFHQVKIQAKNGSDALSRQPIKREDLTALAKQYFDRPLNIGRHFLVSQLAIKKTDVWLIRVLTGHARTHAEPFSDPMGVPPKIALARLSTALEKVFSDLHLEKVPTGEEAPKTRVLSPVSGKTPATHNDGYLHPKISDGFRVLPAPFDTHTLNAIVTIEQVRNLLLKKTSNLSHEGRLIAALTTFNGLDPADQKCIFEDAKNSIVRLRNTTWAIWKRPNCSAEICFPLLGPVLLPLRKIGIASVENWEKHAQAVAVWLKKEIPTIQWPENQMEAFDAFATLALRHRRYICAPSALTAQSRAVPTATPSRRSVLRLASKENHIPADYLGKAIRRATSKSRFQVDGPLEKVAGVLRDAGSTTEQRGEEVKRATDLIQNLDAINTEGNLHALALKKVIRYEAELNVDESKGADQFSSLSGYLNDVLIALSILAESDDPADMSEQEMRDWVESATETIDAEKKDTVAVKSRLNRHHGLKRFLQVGRALGWEVPRDLFETNSRPMFDGMRKSAASTLLITRDHDATQQLLAHHFSEWPVDANRATLAENLLWHAPLRSAEQSLLRKNCVVEAIQSIAIQTEGYSHLKSKHAYRLIPLPEELVAEIQKIAMDPEERDNHFLFLRQDGKDWSRVRAIDEAIVSAAAQVTGETTVRKHTYRASATARRAAPNWEQMAISLIEGDGTTNWHLELLHEDCDRGFPNFIHATRETGHGHSLITSVYYYAVWPFVLSSQLSASLSDCAPDGPLLMEYLEDTTAIRKARSIALKGGRSFDIWNKISQIASNSIDAPALTPIDSQAVVVPRCHDAQTSLPNSEACTMFAAHVLLGQSIDKSSDDWGLTKNLSQKINALLPNTLARESFLKRKRGKASSHALEADRTFLATEEAKVLLKKLLNCQKGLLLQLADDLNPDRRHIVKPQLNAAELLERIKSHLSCIPATLGLQVQFSSVHPLLVGLEDLNILQPRLIVANPTDRIGAHPLFQIVDMKNPEKTTSTGRWSIATRVLVMSVISYFNFQKEYQYE